MAAQALDVIGGSSAGGVTRVTLAGQPLDLRGGGTGTAGGGGLPETRAEAGAGPVPTTSVRELLLRSSFLVSASGDPAGGEPGSAAWAVWGRMATGGFDTDQDGARMEGAVTSGFLGADISPGPWLAGIAFSVSGGSGDFELIEGDNEDAGTVESWLAAGYLYARVWLSDRVTLSGLGGYGIGGLALAWDDRAQRTETDITMLMGALAARGEVLKPAESRGFGMAVKSDAYWARMNSDAVRGRRGDANPGTLSAAQADSVRVRLVLELSHSVYAGGGWLTPSLEFGARYDAGAAAETGIGAEAGAALRYAADGISIAGSVRTLLAHEQSNYREWGADGALRIGPGASGRGLSATLSPSWGAPASGVERLWSLAAARGLGADDEFEATARLAAEVGYGLGLGTAPGVLTPYAGVTLVEGGERSWRGGARWAIAPGTALGLEAARTEAADGAVPAHAVTIDFAAQW